MSPTHDTPSTGAGDLRRNLEDALARIGAHLLAGERVFAGAESFTLPRGPIDVEGARAAVAMGACRIGGCPDPTRVGDLASHIDHTLLKPDATADQVDALCAEAIEHGFASVCVNPTWVARCADILGGSDVLTCTVVGFPLGATFGDVKAIEARRAIDLGACEIDMVMNVGALKSGFHQEVADDIAAVASACRAGGARLKVILETCLLEPDEVSEASRISKAAGADFVKTSTGFGGGGATVEDVARMRAAVGPVLGVKASGGVRDRETADAMIAAGATRIGASASVAIVAG